MVIHYYYNFGKLLYCFISKRNSKFYIFESIGVLFSLLIIFLMNDVIISRFLNPNSNYVESKKIIIALFYSLIFFGTGILSRSLSKSQPEETIIEEDDPPKDNTKRTTKTKNNGKQRVFVGIIDFTWLFIMSLTYGGLSYVVNYDSVSGPLPIGKSNVYYNLYYDEVKYLFQESINIALILGTILAGCMAILWGDAIWRKGDKKSKINYKGTTLASMKMIVAFFIIVLSELIWISVPLYIKMTTIKDLIV
jgi:hypothetical protein